MWTRTLTRVAAPLAVLTCCRGALARSSTTAGSLVTRSIYARASPPALPLWMRLRAGDGSARGLATAVEGKPMMVDTLEDFHAALTSAGDKLVVVDFTASWCGPCKMIAPVFEALAKEHKETIVCLKVDVDENSDTAAECGIRAMPTFQFYKNGAKVDEFAGADQSKLITLITKHTM
mmetsp:Transcript_30475/g.81982  ORF Transcript_30475/g.81982 Transcript_30475/m.81982 type:complete len:177 (+) Transcript_30475:62-592(+)